MSADKMKLASLPNVLLCPIVFSTKIIEIKVKKNHKYSYPWISCLCTGIIYLLTLHLYEDVSI